MVSIRFAPRREGSAVPFTAGPLSPAGRPGRERARLRSSVGMLAATVSEPAYTSA